MVDCDPTKMSLSLLLMKRPCKEDILDILNEVLDHEDELPCPEKCSIIFFTTSALFVFQQASYDPWPLAL